MIASDGGADAVGVAQVRVGHAVGAANGAVVGRADAAESHSAELDDDSRGEEEREMHSSFGKNPDSG